nr:hypothetical protein [Streptomyces flavochromogenes]
MDHRSRRLAEHPEASPAVEATPWCEPGAQADGGGRIVGHELVPEIVDGPGNRGDAVEDFHALKVAHLDLSGQGDDF